MDICQMLFYNFVLTFTMFCRNNILMDICQMLLLQFRLDIYSVLNETYVSMWSDWSMYSAWSNQRFPMALVTYIQIMPRIKHLTY